MLKFQLPHLQCDLEIWSQPIARPVREVLAAGVVARGHEPGWIVSMLRGIVSHIRSDTIRVSRSLFESINSIHFERSLRIGHSDDD